MKNRMYERIVPLALLFVATCSVADDYCHRPDKIDPEYPAGIVGNYEIIGRVPDGRQVYSGKVQILTGDKSYTIKRTVAGKTMTGKAWIEFCSPDRYAVLRFNYDTEKKAFMGICYFRTNGDNYYLISCYTGYSQKSRPSGLESMFELQDP